MAIGDELFSLLGLVPSRDRAGIARGTMADEAKASISANSGNAEGRALIDQGARPPDFELPADIPTAYATGRGPIRAAPYGGPSVIPSVMPPPPSERVVASGPAAAPPPAVVRNSDIILSAMQRQAQAQRMQQIIGSIGMIANAFNRNPDSQASTKASLAGMMAGGGGGAGGGGLPDLKTLLEMRDKETATERMVDQAKRMFGLSDQDARARAATGELTKLFAPDQIRQRAGDELAAKTRMELMKPEVIDELVKLTGQPRPVVEAGIRSGEITPKKLADLREVQSQTTSRDQATKISKADFGVRQEAMTQPEAIAARLSARLGREVTPDEVQLNAATEANWQHWIKETTQGGQADIAAKEAETKGKLATAAKTREESARALAEEGHRTAVAKNPENFAGLYRGITPDQLREYAKSEAGWKEFQKAQAPGLTSKQQEYWTTYVPQEQAEKRTPKSFDEWSKEQARAGGPSPDDLSKTEAVKDVMKNASTKYTEANQIKTNLQNRQIIQDAWEKDIISGGYGVDKQLMLRSTAARVLGKPDVDVDNTQAFFGIMNTEIAAAARLLPGPLSEKELQFIKDMKGGKELSPEGIRTLHVLLDKADRMKLETYNQWRGEEEKHPTRGKLSGQEMYGKVDLPEPGRFLREELEDNPEAIARLRANPTPKERQLFNKRFGPQIAEYVLSRSE